MDGRKSTLRNLFVAALALAAPSAVVYAGDFIRQPSLTRAQAAGDSKTQAMKPAGGNAHANDSPTGGARAGSPRATANRSTAAQSTANRSSGAQQNRAGETHAQPSGKTKANVASASQLIQRAPRSELAAQISSELLTDDAAADQRAEIAVASSLEPGPGWQAVSEELREHVNNCERLLSRSAYLSAMEESRRAIMRLARVLDLRQNKLTSEPAWAQAQQALREALEFTTHERIASDTELFTRIIQSHETPALHGADVSELTPLAAAQHYRAYAEKCLVEASQGHPWFSELYYCMGRALEAQARAGDTHADALLQEALAYYRSARTILPSNATNANQLAYVLLRLDRPGEALAQLNDAVRIPNCPLEAWQNLVEASSRMNDHRIEQWALQNYLALKQQGAAPASETGTLVEVDARQFANMSPYTSGPQAQPQNTSPAASPAPNQPTTPTPAPRTAAAPAAGLFR